LTQRLLSRTVSSASGALRSLLSRPRREVLA